MEVVEELDGPQHFAQVSNWPTPEATAKSDGAKARAALAHGVWMIRYDQESVWSDAIDWKAYRRYAHAYISHKAAADGEPQIILPWPSRDKYADWTVHAGASGQVVYMCEDGDVLVT